MSASTKLSTSVKALCYLSRQGKKGTSSGEIARRIGVNPSKLRQLLSMLVKNGILTAARGKDGGFKLNKSAEKINLQEIYCAIEDRKVFYLHVNDADENHLSDSAKLNNYFLNLFNDVQIEIEDKMQNITVQSIINKVF